MYHPPDYIDNTSDERKLFNVLHALFDSAYLLNDIAVIEAHLAGKSAVGAASGDEEGGDE